MKIENIEVGMKLQHKETGEIYTVIGFGFAPVLDKTYLCKEGNVIRSVIDQWDADLFRKYKGD